MRPEPTPPKPSASSGPLPLIFARCTDLDSGPRTRYDLRAPTIVGDHVYATDARIIARMRATPEIIEAVTAMRGSAERGKFPGVVKFFDDLPAFRFPGIPAPTLADVPRCVRCTGTGTVAETECPTCEGGFEYPAAEPYGCRTCNDVGTVSVPGPCPLCFGSGLYDPAHEKDDESWKGVSMLVADGVRLAYRYLVILRDAKATLHLAAENPGRSSVYFTCPVGIDGVVMLMFVGG